MEEANSEERVFDIATQSTKEHIPTDLKEGLAIVAQGEHMTVQEVMAEAAAEYLAKRQDEYPKVMPLLKHYKDRKQALDMAALSKKIKHVAAEAVIEHMEKNTSETQNCVQVLEYFTERNRGKEQ